MMPPRIYISVGERIWRRTVTKIYHKVVTMLQRPVRLLAHIQPRRLTCFSFTQTSANLFGSNSRMMLIPLGSESSGIDFGNITNGL